MDETIYHITTRQAWDAARAAGVYIDPSLQREGFIHASTRDQVMDTAQRYYTGRDDLVLLCIFAPLLKAELRYEAPNRPGSDQRYPHVYGAIELAAVTRVVDLPLRPDGAFEPPADLTSVQAPSVVGEAPAAIRDVYIRATTFDGAHHWAHPASLLRHDESIVITATRAGLPIERAAGAYTSPFDTRGHYWPDRWFNVIRLEEPGKGLTGYYCNIATPVQFDGESVRYVDLQLDVRVYVDPAGALTCAVMDEDEFEEARQRFGYDEALIARCRAAVDEVIALVQAREFPFDGH